MVFIQTHGFYKMKRGWHNHPLFYKDIFSKRDAFGWLVSEAKWKPETIKIKGKLVNLKRGQLSHSLRFIGEEWVWDKNKVSRFLEQLQSETMIGTEINNGQLVITVCNYDKYQVTYEHDDNNYGTENGQLVGQQRDNIREEVKEKKERKNINTKKKKFDLPEGVNSGMDKTEEEEENLPLSFPWGKYNDSPPKSVGEWASKEFFWPKDLVIETWVGFYSYYLVGKGKKEKSTAKAWLVRWKTWCRRQEKTISTGYKKPTAPARYDERVIPKNI